MLCTVMHHREQSVHNACLSSDEPAEVIVWLQLPGWDSLARSGLTSKAAWMDWGNACETVMLYREHWLTDACLTFDGAAEVKDWLQPPGWLGQPGNVWMDLTDRVEGLGPGPSAEDRDCLIIFEVSPSITSPIVMSKVVAEGDGSGSL